MSVLGKQVYTGTHDPQNLRMRNDMDLNFNTDSFHLYPYQPFHFSHNLENVGLFSLEGLAQAADEMREEFLEYTTTLENPHKFSRGDLVRSVETADTWLFLRNLENIPRYRLAMERFIKTIASYEAKVLGQERLRAVFNPMSFAFISSPKSKTNFHIDPEHNFLFQIRGSKTVFVNNSFVQPIILESEIEDFYANEVDYKLVFNESYSAYMESKPINPGRGVYIPVTSPHTVINNDDVSISYSLTFRSHDSEKYRRIHLANRALRILGLKPRKYNFDSRISAATKQLLFPFLNFVNKR
jgi:hypothetical protein